MDRLNPSLPTTPQHGNLKAAYWFLSPRQHLIEKVLCFCCSLVAFRSLALRSLLKEEGERLRRSSLSTFLWGSTIASYLTMLYYKVRSRTLQYLLQPCHMLTLLNIAAGNSDGPLFQLTTCLLYNPLLAMLFPDFSLYHSRLEVWNYWIEHGLILILPFVRVSQQKARLAPALPCLALSGILAALWHFVLLTPVSIWTASNINMVLVPHKAMNFLQKMYRPVMWAFCSWGLAPLLRSLLTLMRT